MEDIVRGESVSSGWSECFEPLDDVDEVGASFAFRLFGFRHGGSWERSVPIFTSESATPNTVHPHLAILVLE